LDQLTDYLSMINVVLNSYLSKESIPNDSSFPEIAVNLTENIFVTIKSIRPDWIGTNKLNKEEIDKCNGYTLFTDDGSPIVLIDESFFKDSVTKNFNWIEVLIHEITHVCDFIRNRGIMGHNSFDDMLQCLPFWYWTEFHARYKGTLLMLDYVNKLPEEHRRPYEENLFSIADSTASLIQSNTVAEMKRYNLMHLLAEIAAYQEKGFSIPSEKAEQVFPNFEDAIEFLKSKDNVVDFNFLTILKLNLEKIK